MAKKVTAKKVTTKKVKKKRPSWFDDKSQKPVIDQYAQQLDSFLTTVADGKVDDSEIKAQEARVVKLMKEVETQLDDEQHEKVTRLLCELTAYDIMQMLHHMQEVRSKTVFRG